MNTISSREFRATYASLTEPTLVSAYGRVIGLWTPGSDRPQLDIKPEKAPKRPK